MKIALAIITGVALCVWLANAAPRTQHLMAFHPITQDQYEAILGITKGEPVISEARLIASGIAALKGLAAGLSFGLSTSWLPTLISNFIGPERNATKNVLDLPNGYPLCVLKQEEEGINYNVNSGRSNSQEQSDTTNRVSILKCVIVVRQDHLTTTTTPPPEINYNHFEQEQAQAHEHYNYAYPPWYNVPPPYYENSYRNEYGYEDYTPNYDTAQQKDIYPYYTKPQQEHSSKPKSQKPIAKNRKSHPEPANYYDYTLPPTKKRSKTKRDQHSTNSYHQNFAKISYYPDGGYQPAAYPQINYQNQYPKVSYSPSYSYTSPVYIRNPTNLEYPQQSAESQESNEYLKSKKY